MRQSLIVIVMLLSIVLTAAWVVLASPMFAQQRVEFVEVKLSKLLNRPVQVDGDVRILPRNPLRVVVSDLRLPSIADVGDIATLEVLEFELLLSELPSRIVLSDELVARGLDVRLITSADGTRNWINPLTDGVRAETDESAPQERSDGGATRVEGGQAQTRRRWGVDLSDINVSIVNDASGFVFDVLLDSLSYRRGHENKKTQLEGSGRINGQPLEFESNSDARDMFSTSVSIGQTSFVFAGDRTQSKNGMATRLTLNSEIAEVGDLLDALGLVQNIKGRGVLTSDIVIDGKQISIDSFFASIDTPTDVQYTASGSITNLLQFDGVDVDVGIRLHPEGDPPPRAASLQDIKLTRVDMTLRGSNEDLVLESLLVSTNALDQGFGRIGQAAFRKFRRTSEGKLEIRDIELRAGERDAPYLIARGHVGDVLRLRDLSLDGDINVPATQMLSFLSSGRAEQFGAIEGDFILEGDGDLLQLKRFYATVAGTDIWSFETRASVDNMGALGGLVVTTNARIDDPRKFLAALGAAPVAVKPLGFDSEFFGNAIDYVSRTNLASGGTRVDLLLDVVFEEDTPVVRGSLKSDELALADVSSARDFVRSVSDSVKKGVVDRVVQPLVLPDQRVAQPLVIEDAREVQPLVLEQGDATEATRDLLNVDMVLSAASVDLSIEIQRILGIPGLPRMMNQLRLTRGMLTVAPINLRYKGATFAMQAAIDTIKAPQVVSVSGSINGWDLQDIVKQLGADVSASGAVQGRFAMSGRYRSLQTFLRTMVGSVELGMRQGRIDTSLIELAGLGVLPWLFSREMLEGSTRVECMKVPMQINQGRIMTNQTVVETPHVQLVARGFVDVFADRVSVRAEPRPVGRPLARSAVPFEVTGTLSNPQVSAQPGGARSRRADGAASMPVQRVPCTPDIYQLQ